MHGMRDFFSFIHVAGYIGQGLLFAYIEYLILRENIVQIINPLLHVGVLVVMIQTVWFWLFLAMSVFGYFSAQGAQSHIDKENHT